MVASVCSLVLVSGCGGSERTGSTQAETATESASASTKTGVCDKTGIRYTGTTAEGVAICFTLTPDGKDYLEIRYRFVGTSGCPQQAKGPLSISGPSEMSSPGYLLFSDSATGRTILTLTIRGARASGIIEESDFCGGKKFKWSARAAQPLPAQARRNLDPYAQRLCRKPGIRYVGTTAQGIKVCFTLSDNAKAIVENGWNYGRESACPLATGTTVWTGDSETLEVPGHIADNTGLTGTIRGAKASGVLTDTLSCPGKKFTWAARATKPLSARALRNLKPTALKCTEPGIHYVGNAGFVGNIEVCFTLSPDRTQLVETGWRFVRPSGCPNVVPGTIMQNSSSAEVDTSGHFNDDSGLIGTIRRPTSVFSTASGVLADTFYCPGQKFQWTAHRVP